MRLVKGKVYKCVHTFCSSDATRKYIIFSPSIDIVVNMTPYKLPNYPPISSQNYTVNVPCLFIIGFTGEISFNNNPQTGIYDDCCFAKISMEERKLIREKIEINAKAKFEYNIETNTLILK